MTVRVRISSPEVSSYEIVSTPSCGEEVRSRGEGSREWDVHGSVARRKRGGAVRREDLRALE